MASSVVLLVTPREPRGDPNRVDPPLPADLTVHLRAVGVDLNDGWYRVGKGSWPMHWQLSGPERVAIGLRLVADLRRLGYKADVVFSR
jgi:hypothetical protein